MTIAAIDSASRRTAVAFQFGLVLLVLAGLVLLPPRRGAILLIPVASAPPVAAWAIGDDVRLLGRGPLPGSLVVFGDRSRVLALAFAHHSLAVAARAAGCGDGTPVVGG